MRAALVHSQTGKVDNIIALPDDYDPKAENAYKPPTGFVVQTDPNGKARIGGTFQNGSWQDPPVLAPPVLPVTAQDQIDQLTALLVSKGVINQAQADNVRRGKPA